MTIQPDSQNPAAKRLQADDQDPAIAGRLHALRKARGLSLADMAQALGLWGDNGADNLRKMERGARPIPGTLQVLIGYIERDQAAGRAPDVQRPN